MFVVLNAVLFGTIAVCTLMAASSYIAIPARVSRKR